MDDLHDFEKKTLDNKMGIDAQVNRKEIKGDQMRRANLALADIANFIKHDCDIPQLKDAEYIGSMAIHYYVLPTLQAVVNISQVDTLNQMREWTASEGLKQLKNECLAYYGRNRKVRRSGA